ncbi:MAG TPA: hypothetical protein H9807_05035 [Candidatus Bacteroides merdavium]|uniref:Uncharacterized protein n=1 Tax=Candidatus Bacteroides merdavium TaxID=2838472 RepID=A0A9D2GZ87_9BACE|nr:hypothetical protein [Candidatus Bacteroides merdavium]
MTRTEQKKELIEVLQDAPIKMAERFKRDFERMAFDSDTDFNNWIDDVCLEIDHADHKENRFQSTISQAMRERAERIIQEKKNNSVIQGLSEIKYEEKRIRM